LDSNWKKGRGGAEAKENLGGSDTDGCWGDSKKPAASPLLTGGWERRPFTTERQSRGGVNCGKKQS